MYPANFSLQFRSLLNSRSCNGTFKVSPLKKLEKALIRRFPRPATVELEDDDGIIGVISSTAFAGVDSIDRQNQIGELIASCLTREEQRRIQIIVGVTPDEGTGYLAGVD